MIHFHAWLRTRLAATFSARHRSPLWLVSPFPTALMAMAQAAPGADVNAAAQPIKLWKAGELADDMKTLDATPGDNKLYASTAIPVQIILTTGEAQERDRVRVARRA